MDLEGGGLRRSAWGWQYLPKLSRGRERWAFEERILGGNDFVQEVLHTCQVSRSIMPKRVEARGVLRALCVRAGDRFGVGIAEICSASLRREAHAARAAVSHEAVRRHGLTLTTVARHLGVSVNSIARAVQRAEKLDANRRILELD